MKLNLTLDGKIETVATNALGDAVIDSALLSVSIGVVLVGTHIPDPMWSDAFIWGGVAFCAVFGIHCIYGGVTQALMFCQKMDDIEEARNLRAAQAQAQTQVVEAEPSPLGKDELMVEVYNPDGLASKKLRVKLSERPSVEFISRLYVEWFKAQPHKLIGEDALEKLEWGKGGGDKLRTLERFGWIVGRDGATRKSGELLGDADQCIAHFYPAY